ncbi:MAG TPA: EAL domain-containing protein [Geminicoccaceae bacterium]|nr:EAL domain-containing protein [Geminicoccaceae bacterium]
MPAAKRSANHPDRHILLPIAGLVVVAFGLLACALWLDSASQDRLARQHERQLIEHAIALVHRQITITVKDYTHWDEAVRHLALELDPEWADANVGRYIYDNFGFEYSFLIDHGERTVYGQIDGARVAADALVELSRGLAHLVEQARATPVRPDEAPRPAAGLLAAGDEIAVFAVSPLTPQPGSELLLPPGRRPVLVYAKRLGAEFLAGIETDFDLRQVRIERPNAAAPEASVPLLSPTGERLALLGWQPRQPGKELRGRVIAVLICALIVFLSFAALALRNVRRAAAAIREGETRFRDIAEATSDWIWETDERLRVEFVSERFADITGLGPQAVLGRTLAELLHPAEDLELWDRHLADLAARRPFRGVLCRLDDASNQDRTLRVAGKPIFDGEGGFRGYRGTATDITAELEAQSEAWRTARHDPVTGLPNRLLMHERLTQAVAEGRRTTAMAAVLCLDLDHFKEVNDSLGHAAGDLLIRGCGERLQACLREIDTLARLGGDEFAIVQTGVERMADVRRLADRLLGCLDHPFELDGHEVMVSASIGVAMMPMDGEDPQTLLQNADIALYRAKTEGRNRFRFFEPGMDAEQRERKAMEADLRRAVQNGEFEIYYQPQIDLRTRGLAGAEALVRWNHPERGLLPAAAFIQIAEETGLLLTIGEWLIPTACRQAAAWPSCRLSINLSPVQLKHPGVVGLIRDSLARSHLAPYHLELEIPESVLLHDTRAALSTLMQLKELGVRIAIGDFGTGDSSLSYLRKFQFDKLKIDRSFVRDLDGGSDSQAIVKAVVGLGRNLGMVTCAEGVERSDQLELLEREGCDQVQGFLLSQPMPAAAMREYIARAATQPPALEIMVDRPSRRA